MQNGKKWESISRIDQCIKPVPVKKGDLIKMVAVYNIEKHPLCEFQRRMGLIFSTYC